MAPVRSPRVSAVIAGHMLSQRPRANATPRAVGRLQARSYTRVMSDQPRPDENVTILSFDEARKRVGAGEDVGEVTRAFVGGLTTDEKLWCLDGDEEFWPGLVRMAGGAVAQVAGDGYNGRPYFGAQLPRVGFPGIAFSDGPRGVVIGSNTCFPVSMARGATWDPELEGRRSAMRDDASSPGCWRPSRESHRPQFEFRRFRMANAPAPMTTAAAASAITRIQRSRPACVTDDSGRTSDRAPGGCTRKMPHRPASRYGSR